METPSLGVLWCMRAEKEREEGLGVFGLLQIFSFVPHYLLEQRHRTNNTNGFYVTSMRRRETGEVVAVRSRLPVNL
jgi:hypothetical protein